MTRRHLDPHAELVTCGVALMSWHGAHNIAAHCDPRNDFATLILGELTTAAIDLPWLDIDPDQVHADVTAALTTGRPLPLSRTERRLAAIHRHTGHPTAIMRRIIKRCPVLHDRNGTYANRVAVAAAERRRLAQLAAELEAAGYRAAS